VNSRNSISDGQQPAPLSARRFDTSPSSRLSQQPPSKKHPYSRNQTPSNERGVLTIPRLRMLSTTRTAFHVCANTKTERTWYIILLLPTERNCVKRSGLTGCIVHFDHGRSPPLRCGRTNRDHDRRKENPTGEYVFSLNSHIQHCTARNVSHQHSALKPRNNATMTLLLPSAPPVMALAIFQSRPVNTHWNTTTTISYGETAAAANETMLLREELLWAQQSTNCPVSTQFCGLRYSRIDSRHHLHQQHERHGTTRNNNSNNIGWSQQRI
jgi:hypothetical protein